MTRFRRLVSTTVIVMALAATAACGATPASEQRAPAGNERATRLPKPGKLTTGAVYLKLADEPPGRVATSAPELAAIVDVVRSTLAGRPGTFATTTATVVDNATLVAQNANPEYAQLLERWGRQTGAMTAAELQSGGNAGLLRVSIILSRYATPAGAQAAYQYVIRQQTRAVRRMNVQPPPPGRPSWDEATVFFEEITANGRTFGQYTLILRVGPLIGFVTNVGVTGQVSSNDTALFTQALLVHMHAL